MSSYCYSGRFPLTRWLAYGRPTQIISHRLVSTTPQTTDSRDLVTVLVWGYTRPSVGEGRRKLATYALWDNYPYDKGSAVTTFSDYACGGPKQLGQPTDQLQLTVPL